MIDRITCPACGTSSTNPGDILNGYCGHCHAFTGVGAEPSHLWGSSAADDAPTRLLIDTLTPVLAGLDLPIVLPGDAAAQQVAREMLFEGDGISVRHGATIFYGENGEPITLPGREAMTSIIQIRERAGGEMLDKLVSRAGVPIEVSTAYLGVDLSTGGPVPLVWETLVFLGGGVPYILEPVRYMSRAAAHAGHTRVLDAVRAAVTGG